MFANDMVNFVKAMAGADRLRTHSHPDTSALRRDLVDAMMLERECDGSHYWRSK